MKRPSTAVLADSALTNPIFPVLSVVALRHAVDVEGKRLPAGATGTVVASYSDGIGYEVEFDTPFHAVVTLETLDLRA